MYDVGMSWDADLTTTTGETLGSFNFTHNCNKMANTVLAESGCFHSTSFWVELHGLNGVQGKRLLDTLVRALEADPDRFDAMNPSNGWGSRKTLVEVLREMSACVSEQPAMWTTSG